MSGPEFHAALEGAAPEQARRVIVLTSGTYGASARAFMERSALPRIDKPFDAAELRERLRAVIGDG
jgi:DNA-binding response OmpR family regulator